MGKKLRFARRHELAAHTKPTEKEPQNEAFKNAMTISLPLNWADIVHKIVFALFFIICLVQIRNAALMLFAGTFVGIFWHNPFGKRSKPLAALLLGLSITTVGASSDFSAVLLSFDKILIILIMIGLSFAFGLGLGKIIGIPTKVTVLIGSGTAICGGSAIMAAADAMNASEEETAVSLTTIFLFNALGLVFLPLLARSMGLSETQFGLWAALAIHDTGSVIAAAMSYGQAALDYATAVKLLRALFIIPTAMLICFYMSSKAASGKGLIKKTPWFIPGFFIAAAVAHFFPVVQFQSAQLMTFSKLCMLGAMFLLGTSLTKKALSTIGLRPFVLGLILWVPIAAIALGVSIIYG